MTRLGHVLRRALCVISVTCAAPAVSAVAAQSDSLALREAARIAKSVAIGIRGRQSLEHVMSLEHQLRHLDSLPSAVDDKKIIAHAAMADYYRSVGVPDLLRYHVRTVIALAQQLDPKSQAQLATIVFQEYAAFAELSAQQGAPGDAEAILASIPIDVATSPFVARPLALAKGRNALIGKIAPPVQVPTWINAPGQPVVVPVAATGGTTQRAATVIVFTAWWCGPCQDSYVYLRSIAKNFPEQPVSVVLVTARSGHFRTEKKLSRDEEVARLTDYFVKEQKLTFPVALADSAGPPLSNYYVERVPELVVLDAAGVVRTVLQGWDGGTYQHLTAAISEALK
ncbi:MAG: TlpA disulfide reductase family protein [Gemmatimonadaceae bacterium]